MEKYFVFFVDDHSVNRTLSSRMLKRVAEIDGPALFVKESGAEALQSYIALTSQLEDLREENYKIIVVTDFDMPVMNGCQLCEAINHFNRDNPLRRANTVKIIASDSVRTSAIAPLGDPTIEELKLFQVAKGSTEQGGKPSSREGVLDLVEMLGARYNILHDDMRVSYRENKVFYKETRDMVDKIVRDRSMHVAVDVPAVAGSEVRSGPADEEFLAVPGRAVGSGAFGMPRSLRHDSQPKGGEETVRTNWCDRTKKCCASICRG